jgi:hypothetical protein
MAQPETPDYTHTGGFDAEKFTDAFEKRKRDHLYFLVRYTPAAAINALQLIQMMQADFRVIDLRWMAYMLATAFWEASEAVPSTTLVPKLGKGNKPILGPDKQPVMVEKQIKIWNVMTPIDESHPENSRLYKAPVKVKLIDASDTDVLTKMSKRIDAPALIGGAWIVEKDGDQFLVDSSGTQTWKSKGSEPGATFTGAASAAYTRFHGDVCTYTGRGYVQLTWWYNYVAMGVALDRGLELLFSPEKVKEPQTAYDIMAIGMLTGAGFANGRSLSDYIHGTKKDYSNARKMVNYKDTGSYAPIAELALLFEAMLLESRLAPSPAKVEP